MTRPGTPGAPLGAEQQQLLSWTADGKTARQIATMRCCSEYTVRWHLTRIYRQLGARNAAHAVHLAHGLGLLGGADGTTERAA